MNTETPLLPVPEAAAKYGVDARRLRGAVYTNGWRDPIGCAKRDLVYDDATLARWAERHAVNLAG